MNLKVSQSSYPKDSEVSINFDGTFSDRLRASAMKKKDSNTLVVPSRPSIEQKASCGFLQVEAAKKKYAYKWRNKGD